MEERMGFPVLFPIVILEQCLKVIFVVSCVALLCVTFQ